MAFPGGLFQLSRSGRSAGRFDLNLTTFTALQQSAKTDFPGLGLWWRSSRFEFRSSSAFGNSETCATTTPRILSRGDRLPSESIPTAGVISENVQTGSSDENQALHKTGHHQDEQAVIQETEVTPQPNAIGELSTFSDSPAKLSRSRRDHTSSVSYIIQHCLVHLGDVAR